MGTKTIKLILIASSMAAGLWGQTQIDLRTQSKRIDFSGAQSTKPVKAVAVLPATCVAGEMVLLQTAVPGRNVYVCIATNIWAAQTGGMPMPSGDGKILATAGGDSLTWTQPGGDITAFGAGTRVTALQSRPVADKQPQDGQGLVWNQTTGKWEPGTVSSEATVVEAAGNTVGSQPVQNYLPGFGVYNALADTGSKINIEQGINTAVVQTRAMAQSGRSLLCDSTGGPAYTCSMEPALDNYTRGMIVNWIPGADAAGGPITLDIDAVGAAAVKAEDGVSDPRAIAAGRMYPLWYDGAAFRLPSERYDKASWGLCAGQDCMVAETVAVPYVAVARSTISKCYVAAGTAPSGAPLIVDVLKNGASIFGETKLALEDGQLSGSSTSMVDRSVNEGDRLSVAVTQVGSAAAGSGVSIVCRLEL